MKEILNNSVFFGVFINILAFGIGSVLNKKLKWPILNPLLVAVAIVIAIIKVLNLDYENYRTYSKYLSDLLTPATVCLAIPLYQKLELLKKNFLAIFLGIFSGVLASMGSVLALSWMFRLDHAYYVSLLPKSITTAIGMGVSTELGGISTVTVAVIIITGIWGNLVGVAVCRIFRIAEPIAKGLAFGNSAHAIGTTKAMELGEVEGAMSSLAIVIAGLITVISAGLFAGLY